MVFLLYIYFVKYLIKLSVVNILHVICFKFLTNASFENFRPQRKMKLFSLQVLYKCDPKPKLLQSTYELSSFGFFQRASVQEFLDFTAKLVCERTEVCARSAVQERGLVSSLLLSNINDIEFLFI